MSFIPEIFDVIVLETLFLRFKALLEDAAVVVVWDQIEKETLAVGMVAGRGTIGAAPMVRGQTGTMESSGRRIRRAGAMFGATFLKFLLCWNHEVWRSVVAGPPLPVGLVPPAPLREMTINNLLAASADASAPHPLARVVPSFSRYSSSCCAKDIFMKFSVRTSLGT
ncbi:hypothetical protein PCANC_10855 [Puccinia coronata f. sp. avenae]|uniref:Uncharacterized protein n=1 Tax=Puccinia coronata f. sp. avenae TaxID=200324 RepID=A0A2N5V0U9_9BASI|nr:hypothetical protein PCANC_10855 [Puccinia coronata f. sp. avenae]